MQHKDRIGFVGLGTLGQRMTPRLASAGYRPLVFDTNADAVAACVTSCDAVAATSLTELGRGSDIVVLTLPDGPTVAKVVAGEPWGSGDSLAAGLAKGTVVVDMSASDPLAAEKLAAWLEKRGIALVDGPVAGLSGYKYAAEGKLTIMAAGDEKAIERCMPIFRVLGTNIVNLGAVGRGHAVKAFANYISAAALVATMESMLACKRYGIDPTLVLGVFNNSPAYNSITQIKIPEDVMTRTFGTPFPLSYMVKDIRASIELAKAIGIEIPFGTLCLELWRSEEHTSELQSQR